MPEAANGGPPDFRVVTPACGPCRNGVV